MNISISIAQHPTDKIQVTNKQNDKQYFFRNKGVCLKEVIISHKNAFCYPD